MRIDQVRVNGYDDNFSYFIGDNEGNVAVVDPSDVPLLESIIDQEGLNLKMILLTHSHFDHVEGVKALVQKYGVPVFAHINAKGRLPVADTYCVFVDDNEIIKIGDLHIKAMYTPGHIDDALCFYISKENADDNIPKLLTGDTLFVEGCGRADMPESNVKDLFKSLSRIKKLPKETHIYAGHDYGSKPVSTLAWEKMHNAYVHCASFEEFRALRLPN